MLLTGLIAVALASPVAATNPLAPAAEGQLQCYQPDDLKKTCQSLASYKPVDGATYSNTAIVLLSNEHPVTLETSTFVVLKNGAVCGSVRAEDITAG